MNSQKYTKAIYHFLLLYVTGVISLELYEGLVDEFEILNFTIKKEERSY